MEYLPIKVAECLEKYPLFEGLSSLTAYNIRPSDGRKLSTVICIQSGDVGRLIRPGELLICDVQATDLWLKVKISCLSVGLLLRFDIKVLQTATIRQVKNAIFTYALEIIRVQGKELCCEVEDLQLAKASCTPQQARNGAPPTLLPLDDSAQVGDIFSFISCFITGTLIPHENQLIHTTISPYRDSLSGNPSPDDLISKTLSVRRVKIEEIPATQVHKASRSPGHSDVRCQNCTVS